MSARRFHAKEMFSYNHRGKLWFAWILMGSGVVAILLALYYFLYLQHSGFFVIEAINALFSHIYGEVSEATLRGAAYVSVIGGLFFVTLPVELLYLNFLRQDHPLLILLALYIGGFIISYSFNYLVGYRLSKVARKTISARKFYKLKGLVNRYGVWTVFTFNVLPLPSQPLAMILGVFRYNRQRFYIFFLLGQIIKYSVITIGYFYIVG